MADPTNGMGGMGGYGGGSSGRHESTFGPGRRDMRSIMGASADTASAPTSSNAAHAAASYSGYSLPAGDPVNLEAASYRLPAERKFSNAELLSGDRGAPLGIKSDGGIIGKGIDDKGDVIGGTKLKGARGGAFGIGGSFHF